MVMKLSLIGYTMMITNVTFLQHVTIYLVHMNVDVKLDIEVMDTIVK